MKKVIPVFVLIVIFVGSGFAQQVTRLTLDECVELALKNNPQIMQAEFWYEMAGKDVAISRSNLLPRASANLSYNHSTLGPSSAFRIDPRTGIPVPLQPDEVKSWSSSAGASASQTIFDAGVFHGYSQRKNQQKSAGYSLEETKQAIIFYVKQRYYNLLKQQKLLEVQQKSLESAAESKKLADVMFEVGKVPKSDVLQAVVQKNEAELAVIEAENLLSIAGSSLSHVLGFNVDKIIDVEDELDIVDIDVTYEQASELSMLHHPTLLRGNYDLKASENLIGMSVSSFLPSLVGYAGYSWRHEKFSEISNMFETDYNWYAGVQLSIPIFEGFSRVANVSKAKLNYKYSQEIFVQAKKDIALELKESYFLAKQAMKKITVTEAGVESAEANLKLSEEKYRLGSGTMLDLTLAQASNTLAQGNYIQALYDYKLGIARLYKAMGQLND